MAQRPAPTLDFARAYAAHPVLVSPSFDDWSERQDEGDDVDDFEVDDFNDVSPGTGLWESDVEAMAALAVPASPIECNPLALTIRSL